VYPCRAREGATQLHLPTRARKRDTMFSPLPTFAQHATDTDAGDAHDGQHLLSTPDDHPRHLLVPFMTWLNPGDLFAVSSTPFSVPTSLLCPNVSLDRSIRGSRSPRRPAASGGRPAAAWTSTTGATVASLCRPMAHALIWSAPPRAATTMPCARRLDRRRNSGCRDCVRAVDLPGLASSRTDLRDDLTEGRHHGGYVRRIRASLDAFYPINSHDAVRCCVRGVMAYKCSLCCGL
jgi:hypothetical protein